MLHLGVLLVSINDFLDWGQSAQHLTRSVPRWILWGWSPETEFCRLLPITSISAGSCCWVPPACVLPPVTLSVCTQGGDGGRWGAVVVCVCVCVRVYAMPRINICSSGSILQKYLHLSPCFSFVFIFFKIWAFSFCVCFKWEKAVCCKPAKWLFLKSRMSGESEGSKQAE